MADTKISELIEDTQPTSDDLIVTVNNPGGTPVNRKVTISNLNLILDHNSLKNYEAEEHFTQEGITKVGTVTEGNVDAVVTNASDSSKGKVELATISETNTGTDATRAVTPDGLSGSNLGTKALQITVFDYTKEVVTGDGCGYITIPSSYNGMNLVAVHARVITAGTTGTTDIQIYNLTQTADMLSTKITIDSGETGSDTAATAAVIDTSNDDVASWDVLRIDVDAVSTTKPKGLIVTMEFRLP